MPCCCWADNSEQSTATSRLPQLDRVTSRGGDPQLNNSVHVPTGRLAKRTHLVVFAGKATAHGPLTTERGGVTVGVRHRDTTTCHPLLQTIFEAEVRVPQFLRVQGERVDFQILAVTAATLIIGGRRTWGRHVDGERLGCAVVVGKVGLVAPGLAVDEHGDVHRLGAGDGDRHRWSRTSQRKRRFVPVVTMNKASSDSSEID